jgi:hypothetical protein
MVELLKLAAAVLTLLHFLGPWGSLALVAAVIALLAGLYVWGDRLLEWFIHREARAIGRVMKDATIAIHSVTPAPEPDPSVWRTGDDEEDDAFEEDLEASGMPEGEFDWFKIDLSLEPRPDASGEPAAWEPGLIRLRKHDGAPPHALEFSMECLVAQVERWCDGNFVVFAVGSLAGPARIRLYVGVAPGIQDVELSYLGEVIGQVRLPGTGRRARPPHSTHSQRPRTEMRS